MAPPGVSSATGLAGNRARASSKLEKGATDASVINRVTPGICSATSHTTGAMACEAMNALAPESWTI